MAPRLQVGHNQKAVCLILLIMLVSSCRDGSRDNRGLVPASHNNAAQPPRLESAEEALALHRSTQQRENLRELQALQMATLGLHCSRDGRLKLRCDLRLERIPLSAISLSDSNDHVLLIASRGSLIKPSGDNQDINADMFPYGLKTLQFAFV